MTLPTAPTTVVDAAGLPQLGRFTGLASSFDWAALAPPLRRNAWWRRFHHKRWHYVALACDEVFCAAAIVDLGWTSTAFAYVFERRTRSMLGAWAQDGLPGLSANLASHGAGASHFHRGRNQITLCGVQQGALTLTCPGFSLDARFDGIAPCLLATGLVEGGAVHATQKSGGMALAGEGRVDARRIVLDGGVASVDYSNGLLARETSWHWASAHSLRLGFNLQAGYFGANENALWLDGTIIPLGAADFAFDHADPMAQWHVRTDDGLLDLQFTPEGLRRQDKNLLIAASQYVQPIGTFRGWLKPSRDALPIAISELVGVTEAHRSRW